MTRVAAVTGGAGAIGGGIVAGLRAAGHEVAIFDLNGTAVVDLASRAAVQAGAAAVLDRYGRCDVLVYAAAAFDRASLLDLDPETWHRRTRSARSRARPCPGRRPGPATAPTRR